MHMLNPHCGVDRDSRGVVRLTICNAGSLNILGSAVINGVREGLEALATDAQIRVLVLAGQSEKSMIGGADIKEMAQARSDIGGEIHHRLARSLRGGAGVSGAGDRADARLVPRRRARSRRRLRFPDCRARCQIRHAGSAGRHSLGDPCRTVAAADRLGPRPLAGDDRREYRCRRPRWPGDWSTSSRRKAASMPRSSKPSRRCWNAARRRCARKRPCCGNGKNCR